MNGEAPGTPVHAAFLIDALSPGAGTENQLLAILAGLDRDRVMPHLAVLHPPLEIPPTRLARPPLVLGVRRIAGPRGLAGMGRLRRWLRAGRVQVLVTFFRDATVVGTLAAWGSGVHVLSCRRNVGAGYWHTPGWIRVLRWLRRGTLAWVANGEAVREAAIRAESLPPDRVTVVPNLVDTGRFRPADEGERTRARETLGLAQDAQVVLCIANLRPIKRLDVLVKAFSRTRADHPAAVLVVAGEGPERERLEQVILAEKAEEAVRLVGSREDVSSLLAAADLGVLASDGEGYPNALVEYAAAGLPFVATRVGGTVEIAERSGAGTLVPPRDPEALARALSELLALPAGERRKRGAAARAWAVRHHAPEVALEAWARVLEAAARGEPVNGGA